MLSICSLCVSLDKQQEGLSRGVNMEPTLVQQASIKNPKRKIRDSNTSTQNQNLCLVLFACVMCMVKGLAVASVYELLLYIAQANHSGRVDEHGTNAQV